MKPAAESHKTRIEIVVRKGTEELLPETLYNSAGSGLWIEEKGESVIIKSYPQDVEGFLRSLHTSGLRIKDVSIEKEELLDYVELTKKCFKPLRVGELTILPPWNKKKIDGQKIIIEPGMAFGTGRHESTVIMLKLIHSYGVKGQSVLDLGCGSGILSLYANLLGAKRIVAVDNDMDAILSAKRNISLNRARKIQLIGADLRVLKGEFDVVLANLDIQTFKKHSHYIMGLVHRNGKLIISGILNKDRKHIAPLFSPLTLVHSDQKNSWCGFVLGKA